MPGALQLSATAALRMGVGKLTIATTPFVTNLLAPHLPEAMWVPLQSDRDGFIKNLDSSKLRSKLSAFTAIAMGPGIGPKNETFLGMNKITQVFKGPILLDADALKCMNQKRMSSSLTDVVLTPHDDEFKKLFGLEPPQELILRKRCIQHLAQKHQTILLLKGNPTLIANRHGVLYQNPTGNPGMATAGSGDVLTGMIGSLLAQRIEPFLSAQLGAYIHGSAGDFIARQSSQSFLIASDLINALPVILKNIEKLNTIDRLQGVKFQQ